MRALKSAFQIVQVILVMLVFFISIELLGGSFNLMGEGFARTLIETTANPVVGLFVGLLATALVQSSSLVTSMVVSIVAGGGLSVAGAIPIIMGSNIGTSVTNAIVSLGSVTRPDEFRRAFAAANVHDSFNTLTVLILFPLELSFNVVSGTAAFMADIVAGSGGTNLLSPLKLVTEPATAFIISAANSNGIVVMIVGLALLFLSLRQLVVLLKSLILGRAERLLHRYIFGAIVPALLAGMIITALVQSSSITTSLMVPLVGAGIVSVQQVFPFVLGANLGTTITALLAALMLSGSGGPGGLAALTVALAHTTFNAMGILIFLPLKRMRAIPIFLATTLGELAYKRRAFAFAYVATLFFIIPSLVIFFTRDIEFEHKAAIPRALEDSGYVRPEDTLRTDTTAVLDR
ncbi:MAG TPA: Na/Pi symporter [Rhodothermales bacterium]